MSNSPKFFIVNMRFDVMEDEKKVKDPFPWANLYCLEEPKVTDNFAGSNIGKMPIVRDNDNKIAKELHRKYSHMFPGYFYVDFTLTAKAGAMVAAVTNLTPAEDEL